MKDGHKKIAVMALLAAAWLTSGTAVAAAPEEDPGAAKQALKLGEDLIYSVDRTPERTFDTARDVEVITQEEIRRENVATLGQLLQRRPGIAVLNGESGTMPIVRGLGGKQVLFLIDGVKANNATWGGPSREYLYIFDLSQVERIEIVRGVVSVLGTESLGGVINIVTRKGPANGERFAGTIAARYATAEHAVTTSASAGGASARFRYDAGATYTNNSDVTGGSGVGKQAQTGFQQLGGHLNGQWLLSPEKTVSFNVQHVRVQDEETPALLPPKGQIKTGVFDPAVLQLISVSFLDLTDRHWEDSLKVTAYHNRQQLVRDVTLTSRTDPHENDGDSMAGVNLELGTFIGAHHLVYGLDATRESITSSKLPFSEITGKTTPGRGNLMDGATYSTAGIYLQDRADLQTWLTAIGGVRVARYTRAGQESSTVGHFDIGDQRTNMTWALNLIGHVNSRLNVIGNIVSGFRAPNLDDVSRSANKPGFAEIPNPDAAPEKVRSYEGGLKYSDSRINASVFYFQNRFTDLLVKVPSTFNGLTFSDTNGNGIRDAGESLIIQNLNVGSATIEGVEGDLAVQLSSELSLTAGYSRLIGTDKVSGGPLTGMQPASGLLALHYSSTVAAHQPWGEIEYRVTAGQHRLSPTDIVNVYVGAGGSPGFQVVDLRTGLTLSRQVRLSVALENAFDEKYRSIGSNRYEPGRQLVIGTQLHF
jgi:hemoglobin/transferrin/lactoferrin receptor protein